MIRNLVDYALRNRLLVLAVALLLFVWGAISFHNLPVEAYPDVADNYVNIITQWPGHSAEDIEKQITVPTEIQMAGLPDMKNLRSFSLAGCSCNLRFKNRCRRSTESLNQLDRVRRQGFAVDYDFERYFAGSGGSQKINWLLFDPLFFRGVLEDRRAFDHVELGVVGHGRTTISDEDNVLKAAPDGKLHGCVKIDCLPVFRRRSGKQPQCSSA